MRWGSGPLTTDVAVEPSAESCPVSELLTSKRARKHYQVYMYYFTFNNSKRFQVMKTCSLQGSNESVSLMGSHIVSVRLNRTYNQMAEHCPKIGRWVSCICPQHC